MQDLARQVEQLTGRLSEGSGDAVRMRELAAEQQLAEERVAELEAQLAEVSAAQRPAPAQSGSNAQHAGLVAQLQQQVSQLSADKAQADSRVKELELQLETLVDQIGMSRPGQSAAALETKVCFCRWRAYHCATCKHW